MVRLARTRAPSVRLAEARIGEATALREGASAPARENPLLQLRAGPRFTSERGAIADLSFALSWPLDVSGSSGARVRHADAARAAAEGEASDAARVAVAAAIDLYVRFLGAAERLRLAEAQRALDASVLRIAEARRTAGALGDGEVALATALAAGGVARSRQARGEQEALRVELLTALGVDPRAPTEVTGELAPPAESAPLEALLARADRRADALAADLRARSAQTDVEVQRRVGWPVPRLLLQGIRENEVFAQAGVELPLPLYQRNQTARAVAGAVAATRAAERDAVEARVRGEILAAWARSEAAADAFHALEGARGAVEQSERLATRAYELGQSDLTGVVVVRRTTAEARVALADALVAWVRARAALDAAAGVEP